MLGEWCNALALIAPYETTKLARNHTGMGLLSFNAKNPRNSR
jgi:hypothetical protein